MIRAVVRTPAKVNWDLQVLGRRADGFHELRSWFLAAGWWDELRVSAGDGQGPRLLMNGPAASAVPTDSANLVLRAEEAWRAAFPARARAVPPLRWQLDKQIPPAAGLGGGSGNAAGALALLELLAPEPAPAADLAATALALGSDVAFFLTHRGGAEWRGGRGSTRLASAPAPDPWLVIAVPTFGVATAAAYAELAAPGWDASVPPLQRAPSAQPGPNALFAAACRVQPALIGFARALRNSAPFHMTGSGSALFATCPDAASAEDLRRRIEPLCRAVRAVPVLDTPALQPTLTRA
jgi:4-diphosphocytidyl-2-C-methyl-D-erythritol kinase